MPAVEVQQIPEGETPPSVVWCPTCGANFNPPHDCRTYLGTLINIRRDVQAQIDRIEAVLDAEVEGSPWGELPGPGSPADAES